jgi:hypothetical protein
MIVTWYFDFELVLGGVNLHLLHFCNWCKATHVAIGTFEFPGPMSCFLPIVAVVD